MSVNRWLRIAILLCLGCACASGLWAADWMINEDYKQLDARGASDFDILLQGNVAGQITGGGQSSVTNPFAGPTRTTSSDGFGNTVVTFAGTNTIPSDPNINRHVGIYGNGPKPRVLAKAWSFTTDPRRVPVPKSNFAFAYDPTSRALSLTVENTSPDTVTFSEVGYNVTPVELPIDQLTRNGMPVKAFQPLTQFDREFVPGDSETVVISNVDPTSFVQTYATVAFSGSSSSNAYNATGGEWAQVAVGSQSQVPFPKPVTQVPNARLGALFLLALFPVLGGARALAKRRVRGRALLLLCGLATGMAVATAARADVYVLPLLAPARDDMPTVQVGGSTFVIDTGAGTGMVVTAATATAQKMNVAAGTPGMAAGVGGGGVATTTGVPVPGTTVLNGPSTPVTPGGQASTSPPMPATTTVTGLPAGINGLLGSTWLNGFNYGRVGNYFYLVKKDQGAAGLATGIAMASFFGNPPAPAPAPKAATSINRPPGTASAVLSPSPVRIAPDGSVAEDSGQLLAVSLINPNTGATVSAPLLLKTGLEFALISESLASSLGLDLSAPPTLQTVGDFGTIAVRPATLQVRLFPDPSFPTFTVVVGILSPDVNPFGDSFLGGSVFTLLQSWEISAVESDGLTRFYASPKGGTSAATQGLVPKKSHR